MAELEWLDNYIIEKALRNYYEDDKLVVLEHTLKTAVPVGDNYTSYLFRASVKFRINGDNIASTSIMIKVKPLGNDLESLADGLHLFSKEIEMFGKTLPAMYKILGPDLNGCMSSACMLILNKPNKALILEDLSLFGYKMAPRQGGLDLKHCLLVMKKLALFHASSVLLFEKIPNIFKNYDTGILVANEHVESWLKLGLNCLSETCVNSPGMEQYSAKLKKMGSRAWLKGVECGNRKLGGFNVLNHGDIWVNNMLFKYDENGIPNSIKFVDFQLVKYTSPAIDLHYFIGTSPSPDVRKSHLHTLLDVYYNEFTVGLANLNYFSDKIPTKSQFLEDFKARAFYGVLSMATVGALVRASHRDDATFENLWKTDGIESFRYHAYNNKNYKELIAAALPHYDSLGAFE